MKMLKKIKTDMWISVVMMFLIGVLFVVRPQDSLEITAIIAGVIIFVNGIYDLVYYKRAWIILGIFIFTHAGIMTVLFSYVFSIYIIINGIICLETTVYMRRLFHVSSVGYVILSALVVLGGIIMMFFSPDTVKAAAIMTGIIFITNAVINSVILYRIQKISKECAGQIQEAVDALNGNIIDVDDDVK